MIPDISLPIQVPVSVLIAAGLGLVVAFFLTRNLSRHFFFLFILATVIVYLFLAPMTALIIESQVDTQSYTHEYADLMIFSLVFFGTLSVTYWRTVLYLVRRAGASAKVVRIDKKRGRRFAVAMVIVAITFVVVVLRNNLIFTRIGSESAATLIVGISTVDFWVYRVYQIGFPFIAGILLRAVQLSDPGFTKRMLSIALVTNIVAFGAQAVLNSRMAIIYTFVLLLGVYFAGKERYRISLPSALGISAVLGVLLIPVSIAINVRRIGLDNGITLQHFALVSPIGDDQGVNRLNCIDLMARLYEPINKEGPAWGAAWADVYWTFGRFIDPAGFDSFRLTAATTSKAYLWKRYLGWDRSDYYSCMMTDMFGNFHFLGFVLLGLILGVAMGYASISLSQPVAPSHLLLGLFIITSVLVFDQEASSMLFGWIKALPALLLVAITQPFATVRFDKQRGSSWT